MNPFASLRATQLRHALRVAERAALDAAQDAAELADVAARVRDLDERRAAACERAAAHQYASAAAWLRDATQLRAELDRLPRA